mmetsp:Transcript_1979/g.8735  ORF Transcript_1979/g.8735 Transcript_1979/m.8735 type:complete len:227 (-) Transcript_1979:4607-5287(-)
MFSGVVRPACVTGGAAAGGLSEDVGADGAEEPSLFPAAAAPSCSRVLCDRCCRSLRIFRTCSRRFCCMLRTQCIRTSKSCGNSWRTAFFSTMHCRMICSTRSTQDAVWLEFRFLLRQASSSAAVTRRCRTRRIRFVLCRILSRSEIGFTSPIQLASSVRKRGHACRMASRARVKHSRERSSEGPSYIRLKSCCPNLTATSSRDAAGSCAIRDRSPARTSRSSDPVS